MPPALPLKNGTASCVGLWVRKGESWRVDRSWSGAGKGVEPREWKDWGGRGRRQKQCSDYSNGGEWSAVPRRWTAT